MENTKRYCGYDKYSVNYDMEAHKFHVFYQSGVIIADAYVEGIYKKGKKVSDLMDFPICEATYAREKLKDSASLTITFAKKEGARAALTLRFCVGNEGVRLEALTPENHTVSIKGTLCMDTEGIDDAFPVCLDRNAGDLRAAIGAVVSSIDNAIYNKKTDTALVIGKSRQTKLTLTRSTNQFCFAIPLSDVEGRNYAEITVKEHVLEDKYHINFSPVNKNATFSTPPVGWMTWYAVKFDACEEKVLSNAKWQAEHLKDFGANTIWVDWEWYHNAFNCERTDGVCSLCPDPEKYPNGMKYVADKIREMGLIPSLWIGFANEPAKNEYIEKYPEIVVSDELSWCGKYFYDFSNPHYLNEYLPAAVENVHQWGYEAVKYDTLPIAITQHEKYHENMYDSSMTSKEAFRGMVKKTRELLGENMYMLSCAGSTNAEILWASDIFDAARIGDDIFDWEEYLKNCIDKVLMFYPLHNIQLYNDPDNVVLREEFNTFEQAKSRVSLVSLLGLPMTFGDEFSALSEDRINLIKRSLPVLDIHPVDLCKAAFDKRNFLINLNIDKDYETYQVTGVFNMTGEKTSRTLSLSADFHLDEGSYLVYDFYHDTFLGEVSDFVCLEFLPYECRILSLRPCSGIPQVISTSRHITQGAAEIQQMQFKENKLTLTSHLVANDRYTVSVFVPEGYRMKEACGFESHALEKNILRLTVLPKETGEYHFSVQFEKE
ncbi:MAG: hypothetical protein U0L92_04735 [Clostridia bacterium]|nr:hypothetical protein [Clostridia bacterium]